MKKEFIEILSSQFVAVTGGLLAGGLLAFFTKQILLIPGLFVLLPGFLEMKGNISGTMAARLSSALHLGTINPDSKKNKLLRANVIASWALHVIIGLVLGIVAYIAILLFFKINEPKIILVSLIAAIISNMIMQPFTTNLTLWLFRRGHDPDDTMGPYLATIGDVTSILSILLAILVIA